MRDFDQYIARLSPEKRALLEAILLKKRIAPERNQISRQRRTDPCPLSFSQESLWLVEHIHSGPPIYNMPRALNISGALDVEALQKTINTIVDRHEALRTRFTSEGNTLAQIVSEKTVDIPLMDLGNWPESERETELYRLIQEEAYARFDLSRDLMLRARLFKLDEREHVLLIVMHHIASDGWSMDIFFREFGELYRSFSAGMKPELSELPVQYIDYALWQRERLQGDVYEKLLSYWEDQLADIPWLLDLPTDRLRPPQSKHEGGQYAISLSKPLSESLRVLGRSKNATLFMTMLTAFGALLYRYSGQENILIGSPIANRNHVEVEDLIGFFVNMLVLRTDHSGDPSFLELLRRVQGVCLDAYDNQDMPFEKLVEELNPERNMSHSPLFQVVFALNSVVERLPEISGLTITSLKIRETMAKFDLFLSMGETEQGMAGYLEYNQELFDEITIGRMAGHFQMLIEGIVTNPEARISELPLLAEAERHQILVGWNDTQTDYPHDRCVHQLFEERARIAPESVAVVLEDQQLKYGELNAKANQLGHYLRKRGVGPDVLVGFHMERSPDMVIAVLGILKAGGAYLPLDPSYPAERLAFMVEDAQPLLIISQASLMRELTGHGVEMVCIDSDWEDIAQQPLENPYSEALPDNMAYVMYTSGSTGRPKGVEILHKGITRLLFGMDCICLDKSQTLLQMAPMSFDASTFELWGALHHGGKCVLFPDRIPTIDKLELAIQEHGISTIFLTSSLLNMVMDEKPEILSSIQQLLTGAEVLSVNHVRRALDMLPSVQLVNCYGPTESTTFTSCYVIPKQLDDPIRSIPIGRPIKNTQVYILDQFLNPVPVGVPGELHIAGPGLARGYLRRPELTAEKFVPDPFSQDPNSRLYKTGDQARYLPDGNIQFLGRLDRQVKIRGFRVELGEIEMVLNQHPQIRESVVAIQEYTSGSKRLIGYVVAAKDEEPNMDEIRKFLRKKLPDYMIPLIFVPMDSFPLTSTGKIDRRALPIPDQLDTKAEYAAPKTSTQKKMANIWAEVLGLEKIGINSNFFDLGGHSLMAVRIISRLRAVFQIDLPLHMLFESPSVAELSDLVDTIQWISGKQLDKAQEKREEGEL